MWLPRTHCVPEGQPGHRREQDCPTHFSHGPGHGECGERCVIRQRLTERPPEQTAHQQDPHPALYAGEGHRAAPSEPWHEAKRHPDHKQAREPDDLNVAVDLSVRHPGHVNPAQQPLDGERDGQRETADDGEQQRRGDEREMDALV